MGQLALFDASETLLVDDERGRIAYMPAFIDADTARAWFAQTGAGVSWRAERRMMYEREVDVPRLVSHFRLDPPNESVPPAILAAALVAACRFEPKIEENAVPRPEDYKEQIEAFVRDGLTDPTGIRLLWYAAGMVALGVAWMRKVIRIRV